VFRTQRDAEITRSIYGRLPVLVDRRHTPPRFVWPLRYETMFHMTNDSAKFRTEAELIKLGAYRVAGGWWEKGDAKWLSLYEGKMVQAFDHRAASVVVNEANLNRPGQPEAANESQHEDPAWNPTPQFWVSEAEIDDVSDLNGVLGFKEITSATNKRTVIAALLPPVAFGNKIPILIPAPAPLITPQEQARVSGRNVSQFNYGHLSPLLLANINSFVLDYVTRQKIHGNTLNLYILEQLPIVPPDAYHRHFGPRTAEDLIREDVLHLTYTAHDMEPFARDQGYQGPPFAWDEEDRLRRRARLDAVFFHLYGLDRDDADYVLSTFPVVKREEEQRYNGRFRSRVLILGYMAALAAGAPDANIPG
jgi:hypothetical protein